MQEIHNVSRMRWQLLAGRSPGGLEDNIDRPPKNPDKLCRYRTLSHFKASGGKLLKDGKRQSQPGLEPNLKNLDSHL
jgi:hypothetical protein